MEYQRKPMRVSAVKLTAPTVLNNKQGNPGDYMVMFPDGRAGIVSGKYFEKDFEPILNSPKIILPREEEKPKEEERPLKAEFVCVGCGSSVEGKNFNKKSGQCLDCLHTEQKCPNCAAEIKEYQRVGPFCVHCLPGR